MTYSLAAYKQDISRINAEARAWGESITARRLPQADHFALIAKMQAWHTMMSDVYDGLLAKAA
jgi:hypothetical protein